ncbi:GbsR/MarR family transcriptional regulator [Tuberibacillus sp. Marseille-P3662]|uniref:GbsR/MarR family transcriptional regulator n=1 Tax=Tuberibacillus sp. Marseille-P3662 TaxID=1965358 RepID=UPI000A1CEB50|nr:GbsR/MarR family transcriptional regulator [Tuberibacillus sp. Marseille-P3662]
MSIQKPTDNQMAIKKARERVIETISQNMYLYGVTPSIGRLYGTLFFEDRPLTLDDMKEELQMSKTSMSTSVRALTDLNMVEKVWQKGVRKDLYTAKKDWYQIFIDFFTHQWRKVIQSNLQSIDESLSELQQIIDHHDLTSVEQQLAMSDIEKLQSSKEYYLWLDKLFDYFESQEIFETIERME